MHLLRSLPSHAARNQVYVPLEVFDRHKIGLQSVLAGQSTPALKDALIELQMLARHYLAAAAEHIQGLPRAALPAFLPLAPVRASLDRLQRGDAFTPAELSPWRRQWLIWRASRNPARLAALLAK
jgi:15-cis-phytoene synthase